VKTIRYTFGVLGVVLLVCIAGMLSLAAYLDKHKDWLERGASEALGREIRIEDGVTMHWSMTPSITLAGVWVANPEWARGKYLARARRAVVQFDLAALLHRRLDIRQVTLVDADIRLETATEGRRNWDLGHKASSQVALRIERFECENSRIRYHPVAGTDHQLEISDLELLGLGTGKVSAEARLEYRGLAFAVSATASPDTALHPGGSRFNGRLSSGDAVMEFSGHTTASLEFSDMEVGLRMDQLDPSRVLGTTAPALPVAGPLRQVKAQLKTAGDTPEMLVSNLSGEIEIGSSHLALPAVKGRDPVVITLTGTRVSVAPDKPVVLRTVLQYEQQPFQLELTGGTLAQLMSGSKSWRSIKVSAQGQVDREPLRLAGQVGPSNAVLAGRDMKLELMVQHAGLQARLDGTLASLDGLAGSRFDVSASGSSLSRLQPLTGMDMPESKPFTFAARLEGGEQQVELTNITSKVGEVELAGEVRIPLLLQGGRIEGTLRCDSLDLTPYLATGHQGGGDGLALLAWELAPDALQAPDSVLHLELGHVRASDFGFDHVVLDAALDKGHLTLALADRADKLNINVDLKPEASGWRLSLRGKSRLELGSLIDVEKDQDARSQAPVTLDVDLDGTGRSLGDMLDSAEGHTGMVVGAGWLSREVSGYLPLGSVLFSVLSAISPLEKSKTRAHLECAVLQMDVAAGIATSPRGLALRTDSVNVLGGGSLRLRDGEIELHFKTAHRKGLGISVLGVADNFIRLTGTLRQPRVDVNAVGFLAQGGAAWATGGLSLVYESVMRRLSAFSNPCETVLKADGQ